MALGIEVGLGRGHVLDEDPAPPRKKGGTAPLNFRPMSIVANYGAGWIKMPLGTEVWPRPRRHCVGW